jgi:hypothetical protein
MDLMNRYFGTKQKLHLDNTKTSHQTKLGEVNKKNSN